MRTSLLFLACLCLLACTAPKEKATFNPANLESYFVTVDASKDTLLRTPKGAVVKIIKGTFAQNVELEIKEAYTMKDILLAGLTTESNGRPLRSGGMIYVNTKNKEDVAPQKPITVLLPTNGVEEGMQVFKGEENGDSINWMEADTLQPTVNEAMLRNGKAIYVGNCATCHAIQKTLTGPALGGFSTRGPWREFDNLVRWVHNPGLFIPTMDYTKNLVTQFNGQIMPGFPQLTAYDIACAAAFVRNESQKTITDTFQAQTGPAAVATDTLIRFFADNADRSNCFDTTYVSERDSLQLTDNYANELLNDTLPEPDTALPASQAVQGMRNGFTDAMLSDGAYEFRIQTLGWYNVDAYVSGLPGTTLCDLEAWINDDNENTNLSVYAFFPQQKNLSIGSRHPNGSYSFQKVDGKIPLYVGEPGIVLAFGNRHDRFYYGTARFTVKENQKITVSVQAATEDELLRAVKAENIEGINLDVVRQKMMVNPCKGGNSTQPSPSGEALR